MLIPKRKFVLTQYQMNMIHDLGLRTPQDVLDYYRLTQDESIKDIYFATIVMDVQAATDAY